MAAFALFLSPLALCADTPPISAAPDVDEYQLKAVFLYKMAKFVDWPDQGGQHPPLTICVIGNSAFADSLEGVVRANVSPTQEAVVRRVAGAAEARGCRIVYFGASERRRLRAMIESLDGAGILTAGDTQGFALQGCVIDLWIEANKLRFEVNMRAAARARLKISSKLLSLAARVLKE